MKTNIYYIIEQAGGRKDRFDSLEDAKKAWGMLVEYFDNYLKRKEDPAKLLDWWPSMKHDHHTTVEGWKLEGVFNFQFDCKENGIDVTKYMKHTVTTHVEAA